MLSRVLFALVAALLSALLGALFNHGLAFVIQWQQQAHWLVFLLPAVLIVTQLSESRLSRTTREHALLVTRSRRSPDTVAGFLTGPLTWLSHLAGASVGREGVAIRLGRSVAETLSQFPFFVGAGLSGLLIVRIGSAAGFAAVFGTPVASVVFAYEAFRTQLAQPSEAAGSVPKAWMSIFCVGSAAALSHFFAEQLFFVTHPHWIVEPFNLSWKVFVFLLLLSLLFYWFARAHLKILELLSARLAHQRALTMVFAFLLSGLLFTHFFEPYRNLGSNFLNAFFSPTAQAAASGAWDWFFKWLATVASVALGFKGGEVTPLLAIGALLSWALSGLIGVAAKPIAVAGFSGLFAAVLRVPLTGVVLAIEVFGWNGWAGSAVCVLLLLWGRCWDRKLTKGAH